MRASVTRSILLATAFLLAGCGGGGGGGTDIVSTPPPPSPPPAAAFVLIPAASTSQQFAVAGANHLALDDAPRLGAADQLQVRYVASSNSYEIQLPNNPTWIALVGESEVEAAGGGLTVVIQNQSNQYSSLIEYVGGLAGVQAVGIATEAGSVPITGSATYTATAYGWTSETAGSQLVDPLVVGSMTLNFDFAHGSLSGSLSAILDPEWHQYDLGTFNFRETVYSSGSTTFSGRFDTNLAGLNSFAGLFTGPNAEELIGNFAFPYQSPIDSMTYQAAGAFVGERP